MVIVNDSFKFPSRAYYIGGTVLQLAGPILGTLAHWKRGKSVQHNPTQAALVPLCFVTHALFYAGTFRIAYNRTEDARLPSLDRDDDLLQDLGESGDPESKQNEASENAEEGQTEVAWEDDAQYNVSRRQSQESILTFARGGGRSGLGTDSEAFVAQADGLSRAARRTLRRAVLVAIFAYMVLALRAVIRFGAEMHAWVHRLPDLPFAEPSLEWPVAWNSAPHFRPHAIACNGHHIFLADDFHVFELDDRRNLRPICKVLQPIRDITTSCNGKKCHPVLLLPRVGDSEEGAEVELHKCQEGEQSSKLMQTLGDVDHANLYSSDASGEFEEVLVTVRGDELLQNYKSDEGNTWEPEWTMGDSVSKSLRSLSADADLTLLFSDSDVQVRSATSRNIVGTFRLPPSIGNLSSACRMPGTMKALSLSYTGDTPQAHVLTFPGFDDLVSHASHHPTAAGHAKMAQQRREASQSKLKGADPRSNTTSKSAPPEKRLNPHTLIQSGQEARRVKLGRSRSSSCKSWQTSNAASETEAME
jgi:hypothetical protein